MYDLLVQLTGQATLRLLRNAGGDAPGQSTNNDSSSSPSSSDRNVRSPDSSSSPGSLLANNNNSGGGLFVNPLKHDLAAQKRNMDLCLHFKLPLTEKLIMEEIQVGYTSGTISSTVLENGYYPGHLYLTESYMSFESMNKQGPPQQHLPICSLVLPLYTVKRVERLSSGSYATSLSVTTWHGMEHIFHLNVSGSFYPNFLLN